MSGYLPGVPGGQGPSVASDAISTGLRGFLSRSSVKVGKGLAFLGAGAVLSSLALAFTRWQAARAERSLPDEFLLEVDLERLRLVEVKQPTLQALLQGEAANQVELRKVIKALERASKDERVRGLLAHVGRREGLGGVAMVQELRSALQSFKAVAGARGARLVAFAPSFGEAGANATLQYYLASCADKVVMQPTGTLGLLGLQSQMLFMRDLLDKVKVKPLFYTREAYKTAAHALTQRDFTPEHRANTEALLKSLTAQMWEGISQARGLDLWAPEHVLGQAPLMGEEAAAPLTGSSSTEGGVKRLVDALQYKDEVLSEFTRSPKSLEIARKKGGWQASEETEADKRLPRISITKYIMLQEVAEAGKLAGKSGWLSQSPWAGFSSEGRAEAAAEAAAKAAGAGGVLSTSTSTTAAPATGSTLWTRAKRHSTEAAGWVPKALGQGKPKVAVIHMEGGIVQGPVTGPPPATGQQQFIDATKMSAELGRLAEAVDVSAVVIRVNSPGGSALGSDTLHRAIMQLRQAGKKVVISMGDVAASGGMFIAAAGEKVLAQPGTLTGSIGVVFGKVNARGLAQELGINPKSIEAGSPNLTALSPFEDVTPQQEGMINRLMDCVYDDFLGKVAAGRGKSLQEVRSVAGGRVYTGQQAHQVGLVDQLGGLQDAVAEAKRLAGLPDKEGEVIVFDFPPRRLPLALRLLSMLGATNTGQGQTALALLEPHSLSTLLALVSWYNQRPGGSPAGLSASTAAAVAGCPDGVGSMLGAGTLGSGAGAQDARSARMLALARSTLATALALDGQVAAYSPDADLLAQSLH